MNYYISSQIPSFCDMVPCGQVLKYRAEIRSHRCWEVVDQAFFVDRDLWLIGHGSAVFSEQHCLRHCAVSLRGIHYGLLYPPSSGSKYLCSLWLHSNARMNSLEPSVGSIWGCEDQEFIAYRRFNKVFKPWSHQYEKPWEGSCAWFCQQSCLLTHLALVA